MSWQPGNNGRPCTVCRHPQRNEIDAALIEGMGSYRVSASFGVPARSVLRHWVQHLKPTLAAELAEQPELVRDLIERLEAALEVAEDVVSEHAGKPQDWQAAGLASDATRR